jgi:hypothetical protein
MAQTLRELFELPEVSIVAESPEAKSQKKS